MCRNSLFLITIILVTILGCREDFPATDLFPDMNPPRLIQIRKGEDTAMRLEYDSLGRTKRVVQYVQSGDSSVTHLRYNSSNRLVLRQNAYETDSLVFDVNGRLIRQITTFKNSPTIHTTHFSYVSGRLKSARIFSGDTEINRIEYSYDRRGNTTKRKCIITEYTFSYDQKPRPYKDLATLPLDIAQHNNPVYIKYFSAIMSSFPPEFEIVYEYRQDGLPLTEIRTDKRSGISTTLSYIYSDKN